MSTEPSGTIYDLGYKRYVGTRRSQATRWMVIMRQQMRTGWKKWWRFKLSMVLCVITTVAFGVLMYFMSSKPMREFSASGTLPISFLDVGLPLSIEWFCRFGGFILGLTLGASIIANDTQTGAFTFYYVRSIRPLDYVIGKLTGYGLLVGALIAIPPILLAGFRLGMSQDVDELLKNLFILPKVMFIGVLATFVYTTIPLALSSMVPKRGFAIALWALYNVMLGTIMVGASQAGNAWLAALDLQTGLKAVTYDLFDLHVLRGFAPRIPAWEASLLLVAQGLLAIGFVWYAVSRDHKHGVGGAS